MKKFVSALIIILVLLGSVGIGVVNAQATHYVRVHVFDDYNDNGIKDAGENYPTGLNITGLFDANCNGGAVTFDVSTTNGYAILGSAPTTQSLCFSQVRIYLPNTCWSFLGYGTLYKYESFSVGANTINWTFERADATYFHYPSDC